jgi:hypothetical protein
MNGAIFFASKYGSTAQYAEWIDIPVQLPLRPHSVLNGNHLAQVGRLAEVKDLSLNVEPDIADVFYMVKPMWGRELSFQ